MRTRWKLLRPSFETRNMIKLMLRPSSQHEHVSTRMPAGVSSFSRRFIYFLKIYIWFVNVNHRVTDSGLKLGTSIIDVTNNIECFKVYRSQRLIPIFKLRIVFPSHQAVFSFENLDFLLACFSIKICCWWAWTRMKHTLRILINSRSDTIQCSLKLFVKQIFILISILINEKLTQWNSFELIGN